MKQIIPYYCAPIPYVITHRRAGHGMTRKEGCIGRNAEVPRRVWYTPDYTPITAATLLDNVRFPALGYEATQDLKIPYAGPKSSIQATPGSYIKIFFLLR